MPAIDVGALHEQHERFLRRFDDTIADALERVGTDAENQVRTRPTFKQRTGELQNSTDHMLIRTRGGMLVRVRNTAKYAGWIERGTAPHVIRARRAPTLAFFWPRVGSWVYPLKVNHPGTRPYWFLRTAVDDASATMHARLTSELTSLGDAF